MPIPPPEKKSPPQNPATPPVQFKPKHVREYEERAAWLRAKRAHEEDPKRFPPPPQPPPSLSFPSGPPPAVAYTAGIPVTSSAFPAPMPEPVGTDSPPPHASPISSVLGNPLASEPANAERLAAGVVAVVSPHAADAAKAPVGGEQGVTSASLQFTLPDAPSGRTGKKGAWKNTPYKPRKTLPKNQLRTHCISVRVSTVELARLNTDMQVQHKKELAAVLRDAYFNGHRPLVPRVNLDKWVELARTVSNLNQIAIALNCGLLPEDLRPILSELTAEVHALRAELLGQKGGI